MPRQRYERPVILRHQTGLANKFGRSPRRDCLPVIDGVPVADLIERFGSPLFVFSERTLRRTIREAKRAFALRYPKVQFAWSYKTNYLDAICQIFHEEGSWAEVVSEHEYAMARRLGVPGSRILFNGPYKPKAALEMAVADGAHIHVDHYDELYLLETIAEEQGRAIDITIRLNMDTGIYPVWSRFGFNLDNGEALDAARRIRAGGKLRLTGLHAHIGTFILEPDAYRKLATKLAHFAQQLEAEGGPRIESLDLGGGLPSRSTLHSQYSPGTDASPPVERYAEAITSGILQAGFPPDRLPTLFLESGRALVDEAGSLLTRVVGHKRLPSGVRALVVDAGVNVLFTSFWYRHEVLPARENSGMVEETVLYGPLCMNIDVVGAPLRAAAAHGRRRGAGGAPGGGLQRHPVAAVHPHAAPGGAHRRAGADRRDPRGRDHRRHQALRAPARAPGRRPQRLNPDPLEEPRSR